MLDLPLCPRGRACVSLRVRVVGGKEKRGSKTGPHVDGRRRVQAMGAKAAAGA